MTQPHQANKLPAFDGLRGMAAMVVLIHHLRLAFYINSTEQIGKHLATLPWPVARGLRAIAEGFYNGTFAVWVFWVMSAFVLSLQFFLRAERTSGPSAHDYLEDAALRRYPRLFLPVLASVMLAYGLQASGLMFNRELAHKFGWPYDPGWLSEWHAFAPSFPDAVKSAAWDAFFAYDRSRTYNNALWTMEPEFFGSLFLFAFLALFGHRRCRLVLYPVIALCIRKLHVPWLQAFLGGILLCDLFVNGGGILPTRGSLGATVGFLRGSPAIAALSWVGIMTLAGLPDYRDAFYAMLACVAVGLTLLSSPTRRFFSSAIPGFLGRISFGFYLIHVPIMFSFTCWAYLRVSRSYSHDTSVIVVGLATAVLSILGGYALYRWVDRPSITLARWLSARLMGRPRAAIPDGPR